MADKSSIALHPASFRDPAGHIFKSSGKLYRSVSQSGKHDYDLFVSSGLRDELIKKGLLVDYKEVSLAHLKADKSIYKVLQPDLIPFISYPYEWSFGQLKAAALLTLEIQKIALGHGMILKDASAYNVQFVGRQPIFIDTLSFKEYTEGEAWEGYRQYCEHFLAPLALAHYTSLDVLGVLRSSLEGISLDMAVKLLPAKAKSRLGLLSHLFLHNSSQKKYQNVASDKEVAEVKPRPVSRFALDGLMSSLERTTKKLTPPHQKTEWGEYYSFTNYSDDGFKLKHQMVKKMLAKVSQAPKQVWDIGANNGEFSLIAAEQQIYTVAFDIDPIAVERNFMTASPRSDSYMLPLLQDCVNPSPANGFRGSERESLVQRGPADVVLALAIIHHLAIGRNLPLSQIALMLSEFAKNVIIEFVPKSDSKVKILLASRRDIFDEYDEAHFEAAMSVYFELQQKQQIKGTERSLYLFKRK